MIKCKNLAIWDETSIGQPYEADEIVEDSFWFGRELQKFLDPVAAQRLQRALGDALEVLRPVTDRARGGGLVGRCGPSSGMEMN